MTIYYSKSHEWIRIEGDVATVGITAHAAEELGELVFAEAKDAGLEVKQGEPAAVVESVKAASDIYAPIDGAIAGFNEKLSDEPTLIGSDPEGEGWIYKLRVTPGEALQNQLNTLMTADAYKAQL